MRKILYLVLIAASVSCISKNEEPFYRIIGKIEGLGSGKVYLQCKEFKDTSLVENGEFTFSGKLQNPSLCKIEFEGYEISREFYIENSVIKYKGSIDSLDNAEIVGSKLEEDRIAYQNLMSPFNKEYTDLENEYESADANRETQLDSLYEQIELRQVEIQKQFVKQNPSSYLCINILTEIDWSFTSASEYDEYVSFLDTSLNKYEGTVHLKDLVKRMSKVEIGEVAPDFAMTDENGTLVRLSEMYPHSEFLLIDFWASTCGPCRKENVHIRKAYDKYHSKGFDVFGVSTDTKKELWLNAIEKDRLIWTNVCSLEKWQENDVVKTYALRQVSQNFLLDNTGKIIAKDLKGEALISKLDEMLN